MENYLWITHNGAMGVWGVKPQPLKKICNF